MRTLTDNNNRARHIDTASRAPYPPAASTIDTHEIALARTALLETLLRDLGEGPGLVCEIVQRAARLGVDPLRVLSFRLGVGLDAIYQRAAEHLGFAFCDSIEAFVTRQDFAARALDDIATTKSLRASVGGETVLFAAPELDAMIALSMRYPHADSLRGQVCIVPPDAFARAMAAACPDRLMAQATAGPASNWKGLGARMGIRAWSALALVVLTAISLAIAAAAPFGVHTLPAAILSIVLLAPSALRLWAAARAPKVRAQSPRTLLDDARLPRYSILIPLRDEAHMMGQIVRAMRALDYPPEKLDIKLVVEEKSPETVAAARRYLVDPRFSLIVVPEGHPATKPKALNYALPFVRGDHVVIFDAEDVPDPDQLRKAASVFAARPDLACLQATLMIDNADRSWFTRMFAGEYAGHFEVLLAAIGDAGLPMPLGGTSNHVRRSALAKTDGWDAYNVTEDADLGLRLARMKFGCATLASRTMEEAPLTWRSWHRQRTRWMKGWMQTLIVHNYAPWPLWRDLGPLGFLTVNGFIGSMVISTALHGVCLVALLASLVLYPIMTGGVAIAMLVFLGVLLLGYAGSALVTAIGLARIGRRDLSAWLVGLPAYWMIAGLATGSAFYSLFRNPFHWAKTEHGGPPHQMQVAHSAPLRQAEAEPEAPRL